VYCVITKYVYIVLRALPIYGDVAVIMEFCLVDSSNIFHLYSITVTKIIHRLLELSETEEIGRELK
jgi:hypothetical protein